MAEHPAEKLRRAFALQDGARDLSEEELEFIREVFGTYYTDPICNECVTRHTAEHGCLIEDSESAKERRRLAQEMGLIPSEST